MKLHIVITAFEKESIYGNGVIERALEVSSSSLGAMQSLAMGIGPAVEIMAAEAIRERYAALMAEEESEESGS